MILDPLALHDGLAALTQNDFVLDSHQRILKAMHRMASAGEHIDIITVSSALQFSHELDAVGGMAYLALLTEGIPRNPIISNYVRVIRERTVARRGIVACQDAITRLMGRDGTATEILDGLNRILAQDRPDDSKPIGTVLPEAVRALSENSAPAISTGIRELDEMTRGGGRTKELWVIGALPSSGKSALCRQLERAAIAQGYGVHTHSIEVPDVPWVQFHMAHMAGVPPWKLRDISELRRDERSALLAAAQQMEAWPYQIDDAGSVHLNTLLAKSRLSVMRHGTKVVTVDYLQMLHGDEKNLKELLGQAAKRLKQFAKDNDCLVIALSQLSRTGDINGKPIVQHLKESGDIEAAADVIILNYRPKDLETGKYTGDDELIIGKQRNGVVGAIPMRFNPSKLCFESRGWEAY